MSKRSLREIDRKIEEAALVSAGRVGQGVDYLCVIPDTEVITRGLFLKYLRKYPRAKAFGFSEKHTKEIMQLRKEVGVDHYPDKIYSLPVMWNTKQTYLK